MLARVWVFLGEDTRRGADVACAHAFGVSVLAQRLLWRRMWLTELTGGGVAALVKSRGGKIWRGDGLRVL